MLVTRFWQLPLIAGPVFIFMSLLSLRDVMLAYFTLLFVTSVQCKGKLLGLGGAFLLRPHLAFALAFSFALFFVYSKMRLKYKNLGLSIFSLIAYVSGTVAYSVGAVIQNSTNFVAPSTVFSQFKFSQLAANFFGLQFLALSDPDNLIVESSTLTLLFSRVLFFDTLFIPMLFLLAVMRHPEFLGKQKMLTLQAFLFFYGVVSQTNFNSTRQNLPFLACMGLLAVADIEHFRKIKAKVAPKLLMATR